MKRLLLLIALLVLAVIPITSAVAQQFSAADAIVQPPASWILNGFTHEYQQWNNCGPATTTRKTVSYLVNYQRPAEDEEQFIRFYREHHPPIMLRFPGLRRLELGIPVNWQPAPGIDIADRMLFCEVSFDDIYQLNKALASDIRIELRRDYEHFPPFSGTVTHFPMRRQTLI